MASDAAKDLPPFAGLVFCCSAITPEIRQEIALATEEMGGVHKLDLTSDVTHLLVGTLNTAKCKFVAKQRPDIRVLLPEFVQAVRDQWVKAEDVDVGELQKEYMVPVFYGMKMCCTGFEHQSMRDDIRARLEEHGATLSGDLTKQITHLIARKPCGPKYEHARRWNIACVGIEWVKDSIERGLALDEQLYDPNLAPEDRGKDAWNRQIPPAHAIGRRQRDQDQVVEPSARRKLRRTMSRKMESQQENLWADIAKTGSATAENQPDQWEAPGIDSILGIHNPKDPRIEAGTELVIKGHLLGRHPDTVSGRVNTGAPVIYIHGFAADQTRIIKDHVEMFDASVYTSASHFCESFIDPPDGFIIIPHNVSAQALRCIPNKALNLQRATEFWVEICTYKRLLVDPGAHAFCTPLTHQSIPGFSRLKINSSGFVHFELLHMHRVVKMLGGEYRDYLRQDSDVLICKSTSFKEDKLEYALENGIPAVSEHWLHDSLKAGAKLDYSPYLMHLERPNVQMDHADHQSRTANHQPRTGTPEQQNQNLSVGSSHRPELKRQRKHAMFKFGHKKRTLDLEVTKPAPVQRTDAVELASRPEQRKTANTPFFEDEEPTSTNDAVPAAVSPSAGNRPNSQPLQQLSQEQQNSPRRASQSATDLQTSKSTGDPSARKENLGTADCTAHPLQASTVVSETSQAAADLNETVMHLLAIRREARNASLEDTAQPTSGKLGIRRRGPLGRATSDSFARASSLSSNTSQDNVLPSHLGHDLDAGSAAAKVPDPSQKIIYEDERALEKRRDLIRGFGGDHEAVADERRRAESIGVVRDAVGQNNGMMGRGKRKGGRR